LPFFEVWECPPRRSQITPSPRSISSSSPKLSALHSAQDLDRSPFRPVDVTFGIPETSLAHFPSVLHPEGLRFLGVQLGADASQKVCSGRRCSPRQGSQLSLSLRARVFHPNTRRHVRLLGPCYKTGRLKPLCQHPKHVRGTSTRPCGVLSSSIPADVCDPEL